MNVTNFIPAGKTSLVKKKGGSLQVQTEYAFRPYPRFTTTILNNGQVIHKVEKKLIGTIESFEEQEKVEKMMKKQHSEILEILKNDSYPRPASTQPKDKLPPKDLSLNDRLKMIHGIEKIYQLDRDGNFLNKNNSEQFKKIYSGVFKNIKDLIKLFSLVPGVIVTREKGVYEVERNSLYLLSCGDNLYFILVNKDSQNIEYEKVLKETLNKYLQDFSLDK